MYCRLSPTSILRLTDNVAIPENPTNSDYIKFMEWIALGNTLQPPCTIYEDIAFDDEPDENGINAWIITPKPELEKQAIKANMTKAMWVKIQEIRSRVTMGGAKVGDYWFHTDSASRTQYLALVMLGQSIPPNVLWKTMSGEKVMMTATLAQQVFQASIVLDMTVFAIAESIKAQMEASEFPLTFPIDQGWPQDFEQWKLAQIPPVVEEPPVDEEPIETEPTDPPVDDPVDPPVEESTISD